MPGFNGSGVYVRYHNWVEDEANDINISASRMDTEMNGFATALSNCITADGQTTITEDIPFNDKAATDVFVHANVGTESAPSLSFIGDSDTGLYRKAADTVGFAVGGTEVMALSATALEVGVPASLANGTATTPALRFTSDMDTGIYRADADTIGFATGGAERMTLTDDLLDVGVPTKVTDLTVQGETAPTVMGNGALRLPRYTLAEIADASHELNTTYKAQDVLIMKEITASEGQILRAAGPDPTDDWMDLFDINVSHTPN